MDRRAVDVGDAVRREVTRVVSTLTGKLEAVKTPGIAGAVVSARPPRTVSVFARDAGIGD